MKKIFTLSILLSISFLALADDDSMISDNYASMLQSVATQQAEIQARIERQMEEQTEIMRQQAIQKSIDQQRDYLMSDER